MTGSAGNGERGEAEQSGGRRSEAEGRRSEAGELGSNGLGASNGKSRSNGNGRGDGNGLPTESDRQRTVTYLRQRFSRSLSREDIEDIAQEAMVEVYVRIERGELIHDRVAYMRCVAWRDARDLIRDQREMAIDPADDTLIEITDKTARPEDRVDVRAELARSIEAVEQLGPEHRAVYRTRFVEGLSTEEASSKLGVPRSTYHYRLRRAIDTVHQTLEGDRFLVKLLGAYVAGVASRSERKRAELLIGNDPKAAALARELRATHEAVAGALAPVAIDPEASVGFLARLGEAPGRLRDVIGGRSHEAADAVSAIGSARGTGAVGTGVLAKVAGLGAAGKATIACLGTGAAATVCLATGIGPGGGLGAERPERDVTRSEPVAETTIVEAPVTTPVTPAPQPKPESKPDPKPSNPEPKPEPKPDPVEPPPVAPSAPPVEQEFGVVSASTPSSGGGSSGSDGGSSGGSNGGSNFQREFGP